MTPVEAIRETPALGRSNMRMQLYGIVGVAIALFVGLLVYGLRRCKRASAQRAARFAEITAWPARQPFSVTGFASWLVADRPLLDIHLTGAIDQAKLERALQHIEPAITSEPIDERTIRIAVPPRTLHARHGGRIAYGNVAVLDRVFAELLVPLHADGAITRVTMGGLVG